MLFLTFLESGTTCLLLFLPNGCRVQSSPIQLWRLQMPTPGMLRCEKHACWSTSSHQPGPCSTCCAPELWPPAGSGHWQGQGPCQEVPCHLQQEVKVWRLVPGGPGPAWRGWGSGRSCWGPVPSPLWGKPGGPWRRGWHQRSPRHWPGPGAGGSSGRGWPARVGKQKRSRSQTVCHRWNSAGPGSCNGSKGKEGGVMT